MDARSSRSSPSWYFWKVLSLVITLGSLVYVLWQINWQDALVFGETRITGFVQQQQDGSRVLVKGEARFPIPANNTDERAPVFIPGLFTLFRGVHLGLFGLCVLAGVVHLVMMAYRWQVLLRAEQLDPGLGELLRLTWLGTLVSNVMPGATGTDVAQILCICRRCPEKKVQATLTVLVNRLTGLLSLLLMGAVAVLPFRHLPHMAMTSLTLWATIAVIVVGGTVLVTPQFRRWLRLDAWLPRLPFGSKLRQVDECLLHYRKRGKELVFCLGISLFLQAWSIAAVYLLGLSLGMTVPIYHYFMFVPVIFIAGAATPSINGLGVREAAFEFFFTSVGASPSEALALSVLHRCVCLLVSLPGAIFIYLELRAKRGAPAPQEVQELRRAA